MGLAM